MNTIGNFPDPSGSNGKTLWIGDLDTNADESYLARLFEDVAVVKGVKIIRDKSTYVSQGYGFIEFESNEKAKEVLETLNGELIPNSSKTFKLNWASFGNSKGNNTMSNKNDQQEHSIYVGDLDQNVSESILRDYFSKAYSSVIGAKIVVDPSSKVSKGYGFVKFHDSTEAERAMNEMSGKMLMNRPMKINKASWKNKQGSGDLNLNNSNSMNTNINMSAGMGGNQMNMGSMSNPYIGNNGYYSGYMDQNLYMNYYNSQYYANSFNKGAQLDPNMANMMYYNQYYYQGYPQYYLQQQQYQGQGNQVAQGDQGNQGSSQSFTFADKGLTSNTSTHSDSKGDSHQVLYPQPTFYDLNNYYGGVYYNQFANYDNNGSLYGSYTYPPNSSQSNSNANQGSTEAYANDSLISQSSTGVYGSTSQTDEKK